jgi:hypothetical protein
MTRVRRLLCACALAAFAAVMGANAASAQTFYVNARNGTASSKCGVFPGGKPGEHEEEDPCLTIASAVKKAEAAAPPNTIELSTEGPGPFGEYNESVILEKAQDARLTINGEESGVIIDGHATIDSPANGVTLSNVELHGESTPAAVRDVGAGLRLVNDTVLAESVTNGVEASGGGSLAVEGGKVILESATGYAISAIEAPLTVSGVSIFNGDGGIGSESSGIDSRKSVLAVSNTTVSNEGSSKPTQFGIVAESDSSTSIGNTVVKQGGAGMGVIFELSPVTVEGLSVEMMDPASKVEAVDLETNGGSSTFSHLETSGKWAGPAMFAAAGNVTVSDSHLATNLSSNAEALRYTSEKATTGLVIRRSILQAAPKATPATLFAFNGDVTIDSSEILGGTNGVFFESSEGTRTLTIASSTVGAPPGLSLEPSGVVGVDANASGKGPSTAQVAIEGSIFIQPQVDTAAAGDKATVTCTYSAIPSQVQTPNNGTHTGEIGCASGSNGNTNSSAEFASLFAEHLVNYKLSPSSTAIDSVPVGAIALPFGLTPSTTDLEGNPRFEGVACTLLQDKGALELPGHGTSCPGPVIPPSSPPPAPKPLKAVLSALTISPSAFFPAASGATISSASAAKKKKYGAKISYRDSQIATATFTVLRPTSGRMQGRSCKQPSKKNKHGRRCTLYVPVGSFTHTDKAAANSFHFSGRVKGKRLAPGTYRLQAVTHDAAGNGAAIDKSFTIK